MDEFIVQLIITVVIFLFGLMKRASSKKSKVEIRQEELVQEIQEKRLRNRVVVPNVVEPSECTFTNVIDKFNTNVNTVNKEEQVADVDSTLDNEFASNNDELLADFDPKKAFVYSEIFKPKYEEF